MLRINVTDARVTLFSAQALFVFVVHTMNAMSGAMQLSRG